MYPLDVVHNLAVEFSDMESKQAQNLYSDAYAKYKLIEESIVTKENSNTARTEEIAANALNPVEGFTPRKELFLTPKEKFVKLMGDPWMRYFNTFVYIGATPLLRGLVNSGMGGEEIEGEEEISPEEIASVIVAMKRNKKLTR